MIETSLALARALLFVHNELLLFAATFFALGHVDEFAIDCSYLWLRITGRVRTYRIDENDAFFDEPLMGPAAVFIAAWQEAEVIGHTLVHMLDVWPQQDLTVYVGCYRNDSDTIAAAAEAVRGDPRVRLVVNGCDGPTSKANCLNRLFEALNEDERRSGTVARMVLIQDAEDMVDPAALRLLDHAIGRAAFVQLPVVALPQQSSRWVGSHYCDEFAEAHGKVLVVRDALGAAIPGAGVGSCVSRSALAALAAQYGGKPFAERSLTEDYELGLRIAGSGERGRFLRVRAQDGRLVATRAFFPSQLDQSVRQKTRWIHGIALQGWDRLGWDGSPADLWMQLRDRRGPLVALLLLAAYSLVALSLVSHLLEHFGAVILPPLPLPLLVLLTINLFGLVTRFLVRYAFTAREFGWREGLYAIPRIFVSNFIVMIAGRRALLAYLRMLRGAPLVWDKTHHSDHPVRMHGTGNVL